MGAIIASWLLKVHQHDLNDKAVEAPVEGTASEPIEGVAPLTIEQLTESLIGSLESEFGGTFTVSLAERTDD